MLQRFLWTTWDEGVNHMQVTHSYACNNQINQCTPHFFHRLQWAGRVLSDPFQSRSFTILAHKTAAVPGAKIPLPLPFKSSNVSSLTLIEDLRAGLPSLVFSYPESGLLSEETSWSQATWPGKINALAQNAKMYQHSQPKNHIQARPSLWLQAVESAAARRKTCFGVENQRLKKPGKEHFKPEKAILPHSVRKSQQS